MNSTEYAHWMAWFACKHSKCNAFHVIEGYCLSFVVCTTLIVPDKAIRSNSLQQAVLQTRPRQPKTRDDAPSTSQKQLRLLFHVTRTVNGCKNSTTLRVNLQAHSTTRASASAPPET